MYENLGCVLVKLEFKSLLQKNFLLGMQSENSRQLTIPGLYNETGHTLQ
jgi:hypothetical protein